MCGLRPGHHVRRTRRQVDDTSSQRHHVVDRLQQRSVRAVCGENDGIPKRLCRETALKGQTDGYGVLGFRNYADSGEKSISDTARPW